MIKKCKQCGNELEKHIKYCACLYCKIIYDFQGNVTNIKRQHSPGEGICVRGDVYEVKQK